MQSEKNILIVDDDADFNSLLTNIFLQANYKITSCHDPHEALEKLKEGRFDLVVTDHRMPKMTGLEFTQKLREDEPHLPVMMVSGFLDHEGIRTLINLEVGGLFLKPLNVFSLLERTKELFKTQTLIERSHDPEDPEFSKKTRSPIELAGNLPFPFKTYPAKDVKTQTFAKRLYELKDFKSTLIISGHPGAPFKSILRDLESFYEDDATFIRLDAEDLSAPDLAEKIATTSAVLRVALPDLASLSAEQTAIIGGLLDGSNSALPKDVSVRLIFSVSRPLDDLLSDGIIDDNLYFCMGNTEIFVPKLKDAPEDMPKLVKSILKGMSDTPPSLTGNGISFLQGQELPRDFEDLQNVLEKLAALGKENVSQRDIREACPELKPPSKSKNFRDQLLSRRDDYCTAVYTLLDESIEKTAKTLDVKEPLVSSIVEKR